MRRVMPLQARCLLPLALLLVVCLCTPWLESTMARHMLLELPLLVLAGWYSSGVLPKSFAEGRWDAYGMTGMTALLFMSAYWMIPRALELSLNSPPFEAAKLCAFFLLGLILPGSLRRCPWVAQLFFLGNFGAMMAIAGMLYQDVPQRLCNAYLLDDQNFAGAGLVVFAVLASIAWSAHVVKLIAPGKDL